MKKFNSVLCAIVLMVQLIAPLVSLKKARAIDVSVWEGDIQLSEDQILSDADRSNTRCEWQSFYQRLYPASSVNTEDGVTTFASQHDYTLKENDSCVVQNKHGLFSGSLWSPSGNVTDAIEVNSALIAVPSSTGVLVSTTYGSDPYGSSRMSMNYNLPAIGKLGVRYNGSGFNRTASKQWLLSTQAPQFAYANGDPMLFRRVAFSSNGRFMAAALTTGLIIKVNVETRTMQPIAFMSTAARGWQLAISNDGNYVLSHDTNASTLTLHDATGCAVEYENGSLPELMADVSGCVGRDLQAQVMSEHSGVPTSEKRLTNLHFGANSATYGVDISWRHNDVYERHRLTYEPVDYVSQSEGYLAMGDSYSSGEGDLDGENWYESGTDEQGDTETFAGRNLCHLSRRSYPYLMALDLGYLASNASTPPAEGAFHSVACSGAKMHNISGLIGEKQDDGNKIDFAITDNQYRYDDGTEMGGWQPGFTRQNGYFGAKPGLLKPSYDPAAITVGIGGNDAGFGTKLAACLGLGDCEYATSESMRTRVATELATEKVNLVRTYTDVKLAAPESRIFAIGYPQFVQTDGDLCAANVHLSLSERQFIYNATEYFNNVIKAAAAEAGVTYVDVSDILRGTNLCSEAPDNKKTVNGVTLGNDNAVSLVEDGLFKYGLCIVRNCIGNETYHPNSEAHPLYARRILSATNDLAVLNPDASAQDTPLPDSYFGSEAQAFVNALNDNKLTGEDIDQISEFLVDAIGHRTPVISFQELMPGSTAEIQIESDPLSLGSFTVGTDGILHTGVTIPEEVTPGYHEIHIKGVNPFGKVVDYYQPIILGSQEGDFDGDGLADDVDACAISVNSGQDADEDGIDDACDAHIGTAPESVPPDSDEDLSPVCTRLLAMHDLAGEKFFLRPLVKVIAYILRNYCDYEVEQTTNSTWPFGFGHRKHAFSWRHMRNRLY